MVSLFKSFEYGRVLVEIAAAALSVGLRRRQFETRSELWFPLRLKFIRDI